MQMSVAIGPYGSYDPVETPKPLWGSPGAELSTWTTFLKPLYTDTHCVTALQSYTAIQRYTALYIIQLYIAVHYTTYATSLCELPLFALSVAGWCRRAPCLSPCLHCP